MLKKKTKKKSENKFYCELFKLSMVTDFIAVGSTAPYIFRDCNLSRKKPENEASHQIIKHLLKLNKNRESSGRICSNSTSNKLILLVLSSRVCFSFILFYFFKILILT